MIRRVLLSMMLSTVATAFVLYAVAFRPLLRKWGVDPEEGVSRLPGNDLISEPSASDTRRITIEATPDKKQLLAAGRPGPPRSVSSML